MPDNINTTQPEKKSKGLEDIFNFEKKATPETPKVPEQKPEVQPEATPEAAPTREHLEPTQEEEQARRQYTPQPTATPTPTIKSESLVKIENILSEHLDELFLQLTPQQQMTFKQEGEKTASKIDLILQQAKVKAKDILNLIKEWLKLIPGVNKFFLEQEAKIKTDRLLNLREQKEKQK